ncbi:o-succinylbenzoate synthase [Dolichospermum sp. ST_sed1]|nr:o-succinylbenzoate synthase [Dolichospermum sp. ST_sed1]MDD1433729.1 o-succinylbenzoate synthase [Dolichospermum sp. ST_sed6]MDD1436773.1 o-succinylbenzoate synthase [Dolichospermum sp. ST_sed10]MDD1443026.1 o-succinylbenzoate synthase [Dolichospermum sp. ST_sed3]MDD1448711.1 o-succinylbenzoate synthase [Dolichospermum sp. ST_sed8]MDD1457260.1 o-succinylbenzoate synthase [Dolichospermum sp. ST_sed7]MDD1463345.1 o-succinylbenzoate synthase [Dolichospermum sp. ST_sed2]MDD1467756.1 o-succiny
MIYQFSFRYFSQKFTNPIITNHGVWEIRESVIVRLIDDKNKISWGEISPISWFGSETIQQALDFCHQLPQTITKEIIFTISDNLPACQFAFESALIGTEYVNSNLTYSALLPAGKSALNQWNNLWEQGYKTFKWKIGVDEINQELEIFDLLISSLPTSAKLRLDANGGLTYQQAELWLKKCDQLLPKIEFIEQPLPPDKFIEMQELSNFYSTPIALDESIANLPQLESCFQQGWRGIFVIKPGIVGSPFRLREFCKKHQIDVVFSSVFATEIGRQAALQLAAELSANNRAVGFGINHFFKQQEANWLESLWKTF